MEIGDRIKLVRDEVGLNQRDFALSIKIGQSTLAMFERGKRMPKDIHIEQICAKYNIDKDWIKTGEGSMHNTPIENELIMQAATLLGRHDVGFEALVETYSKLTEANREILFKTGIDFFECLTAKLKNQEKKVQGGLILIE